MIPYLQSRKFQCSQNVNFGLCTLECLALREKWPEVVVCPGDWKVIIPIIYFDSLININQWKEFSGYCWSYAITNNLMTIPLFSPISALLCPIIVVNEVDLHLVEKVPTDYRPLAGWINKRLILPGIYELKSNQIVFPQKPGGLEHIFNYWRESIRELMTNLYMQI